MKKVILNSTVITPECRLPQHVILTEGDRIQQILPTEQIDREELKNAEIIDAGGFTVIPGLIDIHTYGCLGVQLTKPERARDELKQLRENYAKFGVTSFLISPPMSEMPQLIEMVRAIAEAIPDANVGASCVGIHLEGPYLDPKKKGAFPIECLKAPNRAEIYQLINAASGWLKIVTMAPNLEGALEAAQILASNGIRVSLGHASQPFESAWESFTPRGVFSLVTHVFNAMSPFQHREPGLAGAAMISDANLMLICDGEHVHPGAVRLLLKACGVERIILVTDSNGGAGLGNGELQLMGQRIFVKNGRATLADGTLAGSVLTQNHSLIRVCDYAGLSFCDAVKMATRNPTRVLGFLAKGFIGKDADADLAIIDEQSGDVRLTMVSGAVVYNNLA